MIYNSTILTTLHAFFQTNFIVISSVFILMSLLKLHENIYDILMHFYIIQKHPTQLLFLYDNDVTTFNFISLFIINVIIKDTSVLKYF